MYTSQRCKRIVLVLSFMGLLMPAFQSRAEAQPLPLRGINERNYRKRMRILGPLGYGQQSAPVPVFGRGPGALAAFFFRGDAGDPVDIWVRSRNGDPVVWLLDGRFNVIAGSADASDDQGAHVTAVLPQVGTYYVAFRDGNFSPRARFVVSLQRGQLSPPRCGPRQHFDGPLGRCVEDAPPLPPTCDAGQRFDVQLGRCVEDLIACAGPSRLGCPPGYACVDDPRDTCDPRIQGPRCGGVCVRGSEPPPPPACDPRLAVRCNSGFVHWDAASCSCISNPTCGAGAGPCPSGYQCVDDPRDDCEPRDGRRQCGGICVIGTATPPPIPPPPVCDPREASRCAPQEHWDAGRCQCVDNPRCGGGLDCPGGYQCFDDPRDDCDPRSGRPCRATCVLTAAPPPQPQGCEQTDVCSVDQHWDQERCQCIGNPSCGRRRDPPCPQGLQCYDDPRDDCDPQAQRCPGLCM